MVNIFTKIDLITILLIIIILMSALSIGMVVRNNKINQELSVEIEINRVIIDDLNGKLRKSDKLNKELNNEIMELTESYLEMEGNYLDLKFEFDKLQRNVREPIPTRSGEPRKVLLGTFEATAYTDDVESQEKWVGQTASGMKPQVGVIAVDPNVIPLGTKLYVEGYGNAIAGDTGGAIKGRIVDVFFNTRDECMQWGRKQVNVWIVD